MSRGHAGVLALLGRLDAWGQRHPRAAAALPWLVSVGAALAGWIALVARSGRWPTGDGPHVLGTAMTFALGLRAGELVSTAACWWSMLEPHPPGAYLPATAVYTAVGTAWPWGHLLASALVLALCADGVRRLGGGPVGALALAASPLVWSQAEAHGLDLWAAACVVQATSHLVASRRLASPGHAAAWGAWTGAALMVKYTAPLFLVLPGVVGVAWAVRRRRWVSLAAAAVAGLVVAAPWYAGHASDVLRYVMASRDPSNQMMALHTPLVHEAWYAAGRLSWYPAAALDAWGWPGAAALAAALLAWRRRPGGPRGTVLVLGAAALGGWLLLSQQMARQDRYLLPLFPLVAALAGSSRLRGLAAPVMAVALACSAGVYARWTEVPAVRDYDHDLARAGRGWPWPQEAYRPTSLDPARFDLDGVVARLASRHDGGPLAVLVDDGIDGPGFGLVLQRVRAAGHRWRLSSVVLMNPWGGPRDPVEASVLHGTCDDGHPAEEVGALLVIARPGDGPKEAWARGWGGVELERWGLPGGWEARLLGRGAAGPASGGGVSP